MKSKISFFNAGLFRSTLRRFWPLWTIHFAGWLLFLPVLTLMNNLGPNKSTKFIFTICESAVFASSVVAFIMAILAAMAVFSFMYSSRSTGLIASLPVRREAIFGSAWLGGVFAVLASNLVIALLTFLFSLDATINTALAFKAAFTWLGVYSMQFILFYGIASLTAVMTGSIAVLPILYIIFNFLAVGMESIIRLDFSCLIWGMSNGSFDCVLDFLSPLVYMVGSFVPDVEYNTPYVADTLGSLLDRECVAVTYSHWLPTVIYCLVGLIFSAAALMVFRKRRMESAGDVVAVRCMHPVFKYGVTVCSALCGGLLLYTVLFALFESRSASVFIMILSMIIFAFIGYFGAKMLLEKSFHVFRGSWVGFIVVCCLCAVFTLCCDLDVCGIGAYVPKEGSIKSITVYQTGSVEDPAIIENYRQLHEKIVSYKDEYEHIVYSDDTESIMFEYKLKNGRTVSREYTLPMDDENVERYYELANTPSLLLERFSPSIPADEEHCSQAILYIGDNQIIDLTPAQAIDFYRNALLPDIKAGHKVISRTYDDIIATMYITFEQEIDNSRYYDSQDIVVEITTDCTECISWIKDNLGIDIEEDTQYYD
ncbi:MAG: ABC transporter permease [Firmicutes bacterium]|nr:ABC transporter permease [Bacillota bacterium]